MLAISLAQININGRNATKYIHAKTVLVVIEEKGDQLLVLSANTPITKTKARNPFYNGKYFPSIKWISC